MCGCADVRMAEVMLSGRAWLEVPKACQRDSAGVECFGSSRTRRSAAKKTDSASGHPTPCLSWFFVAFASSHWNPVMVVQSIIGARVYISKTYARQAGRSSHHLLEHFEDFVLHLADAFVDFHYRRGRLIGVEVAVEIDLVAALADALVLFVGEVRSDPGIRGVGQDFAFELVDDVGAERDVFEILEVVVGLVASERDEGFVIRVIHVKAAKAWDFRGALVQFVAADADGEFAAFDEGSFRADGLGGFVALG
jgi:hypothetical protein